MVSAADPEGGSGWAPGPPPRLVARPGSISRPWTLRRFDLASVARFSFVFYLSVLAVFLLAGIVLWALASVAGLIGSLEHFIKSLFGFTSFHFQAGRILLGSLLVGVVLVLLGTLCNVVGAAVYNLIGGLVGGVRVIVSEEAPGPLGPGPRAPGVPGQPPRPVV